MSVTEAEEFFDGGDGRSRPGTAGESRVPAAHAILGRLADVGLGYLTLGQPLPTLSGGERQRLKLATHLARRAASSSSTSRPTACTSPMSSSCSACSTGLVEGGKSVIVIEHHQAVVARADWIIDLGPGAGHDGGRIVFEGTTRRPHRRPSRPHRRAPRGLRRRLTDALAGHRETSYLTCFDSSPVNPERYRHGARQFLTDRQISSPQAAAVSRGFTWRRGIRLRPKETDCVSEHIGADWTGAVHRQVTIR